MRSTITTESLEQKIYLVRGQRVMLDNGLAALYGVETGALNRAVKRNADRFPEDFMFRLTEDEAEALRCQTGILGMHAYLRSGSAEENSGRGKHRKYLPYVFTEQGVAMLSSVLRSERAVQVNIAIMRSFIKFPGAVASPADLVRRFGEAVPASDVRSGIVFDALRALSRGLEQRETGTGLIREQQTVYRSVAIAGMPA